MNDVPLTPEEQARSLIDEIDAKADKEAGAVIAEARREADRILAEAHRVARARMREVVLRLRGERALARHQQLARLNVEKRQREQQASSRLIGEGRKRLQAALVAQWADPQARAIWLGNLVSLAGRYFAGGTWIVEAPLGIPEDEKVRLSEQAFSRFAARLDWRSDADIEAGARIGFDEAVLDATPSGLLADSYDIDAALLAEIIRAGEEAAGEEGTR